MLCSYQDFVRVYVQVCVRNAHLLPKQLANRCRRKHAGLLETSVGLLHETVLQHAQEFVESRTP